MSGIRHIFLKFRTSGTETSKFFEFRIESPKQPYSCEKWTARDSRIVDTAATVTAVLFRGDTTPRLIYTDSGILSN